MITERAQLEALLGQGVGLPSWSGVSDAAAPILEQLCRARLADKPDQTVEDLDEADDDHYDDPDALLDRVLRLLASLRAGLLLPDEAAALGARWLRALQGRYLSHDNHKFNVMYDVLIEGRQRSHRVDAVLYVDGVALALVALAPEPGVAQAGFEDMFFDCPAWGLVPKLLVILGSAACAVGAHVAPQTSWWRCDARYARVFLQPAVLLRILRHDLADVGYPATKGPTLAPTDVIVAAERALDVTLHGDDGLISLTDPLDLPVLLRALGGRLTDADRQVFVVASTDALLTWLEANIDGAQPFAEYDELYHEPHVVLAQMGQLAERYKQRGAEDSEDRVVVVVGVEQGMLSAAGFAARQLLPYAEWIAITMRAPADIPPELLHAFAHPSDPDGLLAVVSPSGR